MNCPKCESANCECLTPLEALGRVSRGLGGVAEARVLGEALRTLQAMVDWEQECERMLQSEVDEAEYYARWMYQHKEPQQEWDSHLAEWTRWTDRKPQVA